MTSQTASVVERGRTVFGEIEDGGRPLSVFREPVDGEERRSTMRFLGVSEVGVSELGAAVRLFVLAELGADDVPFPLAAAIVEDLGPAWHLRAARCLPMDEARLAEELVRAATVAGAIRLTGGSPADGTSARVLSHVSPASTARDGCVTLEL